MAFKVGTYYKLKIDPANFLADKYIDENYGIVDFADCSAFKLSQISAYEDINGKSVKYLGPPTLSHGSTEALILVETKFGNVKMVMDEGSLIPLTISAQSLHMPVCVCAITVIMSCGCQCGSFQKEQAIKTELIIKR